MGLVLVHEGDRGARSAPEAVPCPGRELKPPRTAAYDNGAMGIGHGIFGRPGNADMIFVPDYASLDETLSRALCSLPDRSAAFRLPRRRGRQLSRDALEQGQMAGTHGRSRPAARGSGSFRGD